ncbi:DUF1285 domain-containing protein [Aestuariirhabdus sp. LZHN29]|uniref:DUF1285 domain-containing protein n=1 Tax=Aestuariirhabdus sp. LZHN29 TaxID=3417462 RepID=UPI003CF44144
MGNTPGALARALAGLRPNKGLPPVEDWQPSTHGDSEMRIDRNGDWYYQGSTIERSALVRLFSTILRCDEGIHYLVTPAEKLSIEVEDAPFVAIDLEPQSMHADPLRFVTNLGDVVPLDSQHPLEVVIDAKGEGIPYILVRGALRARIHRNLFYHLVEHHCIEKVLGNQRHLGVVSSGAFFSLGKLQEH